MYKQRQFFLHKAGRENNVSSSFMKNLTCTKTHIEHEWASRNEREDVFMKELAAIRTTILVKLKEYKRGNTVIISS